MMNKSCQEFAVAKGSFAVKNDRGLHTRPTTELVKCASKFRSKITLSYRKMKVSAKSMLGILMLAASKGARIRVEAEGSDADQAIESLCLLASRNFNVKY